MAEYIVDLIGKECSIDGGEKNVRGTRDNDPEVVFEGN
jgi:hypothetical protein